MSETQTAPAAKPPTPNLNKALSQLQGKLPKIAKGKHVKVDGREGKRGFEYDYAELADVAAAVYPLLAEFGLAFHCAVTRDPADLRLMILEWFLLHESGEERSGEWPLGPASQSPQSLGSAITYGRRYILGTATGAVTEDDDDGQRAQRDHGQRQSAGDVFDNAAPAPARNGAARRQEAPPQEAPPQEGPPVPPPLDPDDSWALLLADIKTPEDADAAEAQLKKAYDAGEVSGERATQILHWIRVKAAPMRTAARSAPRPGVNQGAEPAGDEKWMAEFRSRLEAAEEDALTPMLGEVGRAVAGRVITPDQGSALSGEVRERRRALKEQAAAEAAAEATEATAA